MTNVHFAADKSFHTKTTKQIKQKNEGIVTAETLTAQLFPSHFLAISLSISFSLALSLTRFRKIWAGVVGYLSGRVSGDLRVEGAGDGFLECTHLHSSFSLAEQREEVGEMRGRLLSLLWAAPARGERINCELWPYTFHSPILLPTPCNIYIKNGQKCIFTGMKSTLLRSSRFHFHEWTACKIEK